MISNSEFNSEELQQVLNSEIRKHIDLRYYRRFYLDQASTTDDAIEDFLVRGWDAGHNLNPFLHTIFVQNYYPNQVKSLLDFLKFINRPIYPNALCSKEVRPLDLYDDVHNELHYSNLKHYFSFARMVRGTYRT